MLFAIGRRKPVVHPVFYKRKIVHQAILKKVYSLLCLNLDGKTKSILAPNQYRCKKCKAISALIPTHCKVISVQDKHTNLYRTYTEVIEKL